MIAIPAIDLIDNRIVRLFRGDYDQQLVYPFNPLDYALEMEAGGLEYLHLVDLSGAKNGRIIHRHLLQEITSGTSLKVDFGGGVKTESDIRELLDLGANQVVIGSLCATNPALVLSWIRKFGVHRFILALDTDGIQLKIKGWQESSGITLDECMRFFSRFQGLTILSTDIRKDGTGTGPNTELYRKLTSQFPEQRWIASGGVSSLSDLEELREAGCYACVVGKALLDGSMTFNELKIFNDAGI